MPKEKNKGEENRGRKRKPKLWLKRGDRNAMKDQAKKKNLKFIFLI